MKILKSIATFATVATIGLLTGCGHQPVALNGLQPGMTLEAARAAAPAGTQLYCKGSGNEFIDSKIAEVVSGWNTDLRYCVWQSNATNDIQPVGIGSIGSATYVLAFAAKPGADQRMSIKSMYSLAMNGGDPQASIPDADWNLETFRVDNLPVNAYQAVVKEVSAKLGKPEPEQSKDSIFPYIGSYWADDAGYLDVTQSTPNKASNDAGKVTVILSKPVSNGKA
ncbi:hypothetical protein PQQ65_32235 [Paraburkholderia strydomiana]|uniref:hypothetical protein n=1 Tax=Paraburkholderia strydomiana TaxID=1245417 RepID=UPI0038BA9BA6